MLSKNILLAVLAAAVSVVNAQELMGFNYGASKGEGIPKLSEDFEREFRAAQSIATQNGKFNSARLYTMIQYGSTTSEPIQAIQAAINTKTRLLLGMWTSGTKDISPEINALTNAIKKYGKDFTDLVVGLSIGSEDLYRNSDMGVINKAGIGADPGDLVKFIGNVKSALKDTALNTVPIGHVDTWTAWVNGTNAEVINAIDWLGFDGYPYFQSTMANSIDVASNLFWDAVDATTGAAGGKEVWITETGWPISGPTFNLATADVKSAQTYWNDVGCRLFSKYKTFWYILEEYGASPDFGVLKPDFKTPQYDLSCKGIKAGRVVASSSAAPSTTAAPSKETGSSYKPGSTFAIVSTTAGGNGKSPASPTGSSESSGTSGDAVATPSASDKPSGAVSFATPASAFTILAFQMLSLLGAMTFAAVFAI